MYDMTRLRPEPGSVSCAWRSVYRDASIWPVGMLSSDRSLKGLSHPRPTSESMRSTNGWSAPCPGAGFLELGGQAEEGRFIAESAEKMHTNRQSVGVPP